MLPLLFLTTMQNQHTEHHWNLFIWIKLIVEDSSIGLVQLPINELPIVILKNPLNQGKVASLTRGYMFKHSIFVLPFAICIDSDSSIITQTFQNF